MRRGHNSIGGWRNENPRHYRPRNDGNPHFRSSRSYGLLDPPRFPPPNSRSMRPQFHSRSEKSDRSEYPEWNRSRRSSGYHRSHQHVDRPIIPMLPQGRHNNDNHKSTFKETSSFYKDIRVDNFHVNSMGDVDHRQIPQMRDAFVQPVTTSWPTEGTLQQACNKNQVTESGEGSKLSAEYTGHRPPASDHYGSNPTNFFSAIDNSHTFSRSVVDTVDLIRKRLLNRNEQPHSSENFDNNENSGNVQTKQRQREKSYTLISNQQDPPIKKKYQRQKTSDKSNCAKIKNKIVHQLFKMDKGKIHKLMDNPNSSTKFEYAISSLITESQNSFNRHLRSAAEKSLCSSGAEFMQNDNNTIYEDTFMKQMQCILDPQDTVLLEDIKPIVLAELSKVLEIDEYGQNYDVVEDDNTYSQQNEQHFFNTYRNNEFSHENYDHDKDNDLNNIPNVDNIKPENIDNCNDNNYKAYGDNKVQYTDSKKLFERQSRRKSYSGNEEGSLNSDNYFYNQSVSDKSADEDIRPEAQLFGTSSDHISEDDDPFAEFDKQYHVAVDHDFIEQDDLSNPTNARNSCNANLITIKTEIESKTQEKDLDYLTEGVSNQLRDMFKFTHTINKTCESQELRESDNFQYKQENLNNNVCTQKSNILVSCAKESNNEKPKHDSKEMTKENENIDHPTPVLKSAMASNSRKRSIDQRPSHRKEKRKKVESCQSESNKQILNKNIIINVNDCASKTSDNCETSKSIFNLFFSKEDNKTTTKENKKVGSNDKNYTEKHVKRKETPKKATERDAKVRKDSTSSQVTSPNENNSINISPVLNKPEAKTTLKTIDMFTEQPRKVNVHHAHRNTAHTPVVPKIHTENCTKTKVPIAHQVIKKHVAVQAIKKLNAKETQTDIKKFAVKAIQTDFIVPERLGIRATDAFERMKEIDLEIQVLLQEKFKLYNSIETKDSGTKSLQTLGMTVLNVDHFDGEEIITTDEVLTEDAIVDDFTNIPVEELEQLALETVQENQIDTPKVERRNRRRKISYQDSIHSESPTTVGKRKNKKAKSPNISLIEQIITDDRPLEDIISLDDLEVPQTAKSKTHKTRQTAKTKKFGRPKIVKSNAPKIEMKECSVVLVRTDLSQYLKLAEQSEPEKPYEIITEDLFEEIDQREIVQLEDNIVDESVVNHIQIDMLDVSEDIVVGDDCEVKCIDDKEIVENISVPISEEIILDNSQSSMEEVTTPAMCQGGECKMYDYSADENLRRDSVVVTGNGDAVLAIECVENNFLAACLDGNVYYFNHEGQLITTLRGSNLAVTCLTIVKEKYGTTVYTGSLDSRIRYYDLETGIEKGPECNVLSPIQTMDRAWDTVFVGTRTGFVLQFECKNNMLIPVSSVKFSDQSILALRAMKEGPRKVLLVAARSENVTIKDAQTGLLLRTLDGPKMTVYSLLYEDGKVYSGTSSHQIHVFDYTSGSHVGTHEGGKGAVCLRATGGLLFAGCYDGCVYVYREGEGQPFAQIRGPSLMLLSLAVVGSKIIAGYKDRSLYIWKIPLCILQEMIL
ncbi:repetitive organellar protein [Nymphalis io]|uniref:repetitive organellar protein n=1 Tax=Inachis io TaxID=171585 RepID=UPI00216AA037|nr:repetitive organellar protein [Nymphalis io]